MLTDDFFLYSGLGGFEDRSVDVDLFRRLLAGPETNRPDVELGPALAQLVRDQLTIFGTSGALSVANDEIRAALRALRAVCTRLGVPYAVPFIDYDSFKSWWVQHGAYGNYQARRDLLAGLFDDMQGQLYLLEEQSLGAGLTEPISPDTGTGWPAVDREIVELRRQFLSADTAQGYNAVGLDCVRLLEALSAALYDPVGRAPWGGGSRSVTLGFAS